MSNEYYSGYYKRYEPIFGSWRIVRMIGEGSFGKVFEIQREDFGTVYKAALKAITIPTNETEIQEVLAEGMDENSAHSYFGSFVQELVQEFALMSQLKGNSNIVSYEDHIVVPHENGIGWDILIRMELLTPLNAYMKTNSLKREDVIRLGVDMCHALELCEKRNILHRDLKPENIFVSADGYFKLGDFGIARTVEKTTGGLSKKGTYTYIAPEVYKGEPYGKTVDIYSLGIVLYRLMNGNRAPFLPPAPEIITPSAREEALARRLSGETLPPPRNAAPELAQIILKACAYHPHDRYASAAQMRRELEALLYERQEAPGEAVRDPSLTAPVQEMEPTQSSATVYESSQQSAPVQTPEAEPPRGKQDKKPSHTILFTAVAGLLILAVLWIGYAVGRSNQPDVPDSEKTIAAPTESTAALTESTAAPTESTAAPTESTTAPTESTAAPTESTTAPTESTAVPTENTTATTAPTETTAAPTEETTQPTEAFPAVHVMAAAENLNWIDFDYDAGGDQFFWGQTKYKRRDVKTVSFQSTLSGVPDNASDVSEAGDRSVLAWMDGGNLYVAANGKIAPNSNASWMFAYFVNLQKIDFGDCLDTSNVTDMSWMFCMCGLASLDLSGFDTANVTDMGGMFADCHGLTSLNFSGLDTSNVTSMCQMFNGCWSLTSLDFSGLDTSNVTDMSNMFYYCCGLTSLDLSGLDTSNVTDMNNMFWCCSSLTELDVSGFDTANVTNMYSMFWCCSSLTELDVSGFDTANVTDMSSMFSGCGSLTELDVSGFNTAKATDMRDMFSECSRLTNLRCSDKKILAEYEKVFPNVLSEEVHVMAAAENLSGIDNDARRDQFFWGQTKYKRKDVKTVSFQSTLDGAPGNASDVSEAGDGSILAWMDGGNLHVAANGKIAPNPNASWMFAYFVNLEKIDFGDCLDTSNVTDMSYMFFLCSLTELDVSGFDTSNVTDMSYMFCECRSLTELDVSGFDTSNVTDMCDMFGVCRSLTSLDVSGFDTANVTDMGYMFTVCDSLKSLDVSGFNTSNVTDMGYMFNMCGSLTELDVSGFDTANVTDMDSMFSGCSGLTNLRCSDKKILAEYEKVFPNVLSEEVHVMAAAESLSGIDYDARSGQFFWGQTKYRRRDVETVSFQSTLDGVPGNASDVSETGDGSILAWMDGGNLYVAANGKIAPNSDASYMFAYFENLKKIDFGNCFDTSNVTDMSSMFNECSSLKELDLSGFDTANVKRMYSMFSVCGSLTKLDVSGFNTANVTDMINMFNECSSLKELDLSSFDTANVTYMDSMFSECGSLTKLDVSGFDTSNVTNMSAMFSFCGSLRELDLSGFNTANVTSMSMMFSYCGSLTELDLSSFDTANVTTMTDMFNNCSGLTSLDLSGFDTANVTKMGSMFSGCSSLTELDVSGFNTAKATDMSNMFSMCRSLTNLKCSDKKILAEYHKR